jgi:hypothetical protein
MKKILLIMLLTFTSLVYAGEGRYTMVYDEFWKGVYVLDSKDGSVKYCLVSSPERPPKCSKPSKD